MYKIKQYSYRLYIIVERVRKKREKGLLNSKHFRRKFPFRLHFYFNVFKQITLQKTNIDSCFKY